jgi:hypothetical protein
LFLRVSIFLSYQGTLPLLQWLPQWCGCTYGVATAMVAYVLAAIAAPLPPLLRLLKVPLLRHHHPFLGSTCSAANSHAVYM